MSRLPRLDIEKFARTYRLEYAETGHHHCHEGWVQLHCPFCAGGSYGFHLGFSLERGNFNCWRCGGHSLWKVVGAFLKTARPDLIGRAVAQNATRGSVYERQREIQRQKQLKPIPNLGSLSLRHRAYLRSRGFKPGRLVEEWGLQGTKHLSAKWSWRVVAPICEPSGRLVAYVGRSIKPDFKPKYLVTKDEECLVDPKSLIYGIHKCEERRGVVVVEGPADVWRLGPGAAGLLGIDWKAPQANLLRRFRRRFILFDSVAKKNPTEEDIRAKRRAEKLANYLGMFPGETEIISGFKTDPGDMSDRLARRIMKKLLGV